MSANQYVREEQARLEKFVKREYWRLRADGRFAYTRAPLIIPDGDERCDIGKDACTCMKRKGHDGLHACAHGIWKANTPRP